MGVIDKKALKGLKEAMDKLITHKERIFSKIDDEMYLLAKSEKDEKKKDDAQRNLAIFIIAELLDSFDKKDQDIVLEVLNEAFK